MSSAGLGGAICAGAVVAVALDVDGTLLTPRHVVAPATLQAVRSLQARGILVVLATSRSPSGLLPVQEHLGLAHEWFVCYQGALVGRRRGSRIEVLAEHVIDPAAVKAVEAAALASGLSVGRYSGLDWFVHRFDAEVASQAAITRETPQPVPAGADLLPPTHKVLVTTDDTALLPDLDAMAAALPAGVTGSYSHRNFLEITAAGVDKGAALRTLAAHLRLPLERFAAIGDGANDLELLRSVGLPIAMGHAPDQVREAAVLVTATNADDGVARALVALGLCSSPTAASSPDSTEVPQ